MSFLFDSSAVFRLAPALSIAAVFAVSAAPIPAHGFSIELRGAAPLRIERQRRYALRPPERHSVEPAKDAIRLRLERIGSYEGAPVFIRLFKAESELELWVQTRTRYVLFKRYRICFWSGSLGPKLHEGDRQTPEGFYTITRRRLHWSRRWARSLNIGYPNAFDRLHHRTGSHILIHGGCSSIGCFSMTNAVVSEVHHLVRSAIMRGQKHVHVHAFPFRMTASNLRRFEQEPWIAFWRSLKPGYDAFERTRLPPQVAICGKRYVVRSLPNLLAGDPGGIRALDRRLSRYAARGGTRIMPSRSDWECAPPAPIKTGMAAMGNRFIAGGASLTTTARRRHRRWYR